MGHLHPLARPEFDRGAVAPAFPMANLALHFRMTDAQQAALDKLLRDQQDPASGVYHKWLTPEQFADRFGLSTDDINRIVVWMQSQGFHVEDVARSRNSVTFSGTAAQLQQAFRTEIHHFNVNGELHYASASEPAIPSALAGIVLRIRGLDDFRPRPKGLHFSRGHNLLAVSRYTIGSPASHFISPDDFATIYNVKALYAAGSDGTGQKIAVMGQTNIQTSDIDRFRSLSGLSVNTPQVILTGTDPGSNTTDLPEADLDLEWSGAVAKNAQIIYVNSTNVFTSLQFTVQNNLAPVISISYGLCEAQISNLNLLALNLLAQQANVQGQTILASSGDSGAADCDFQVASATQGPAVDVPASIPSVTGVGGTEFSADVANPNTYWSSTNNGSNGSVLAYIPETSWNDPPSGPSPQIAASGGGASTQFTKPIWQTGTGVPTDGARDVPDISFSASARHDGYLVCTSGSCVNGYLDGLGQLMVVGGTSVATPAFAGILALINQLTVSTGQGNINPTLYQLAASNPSAFHDIATGSNIVPCTSGSTGCPGSGSFGFSAGTGYDLVTGLGSADAFALASIWPALGGGGTPDFSISSAPASVTVASGSTTTTTLTLTAANGFTGTVNFTCTLPAPFIASDCTVSPASVNTSGTTTLNIGTASAFLVAPRTRWFIFPHNPSPVIAVLCLTMLFGVAAAAKFLRPGGVHGRRAAVVVCMLLLVIAGFGAAGCSHFIPPNSSGGGSGTNVPSGTAANAVVTATSGSLIHSTVVSVTVN